MWGGLSCADDGCHGNGNKLRYSFKVLVLRNRKSVMSGVLSICATLSDFLYPVRMACSTKVKCWVWNNKMLKCVLLSFCGQNPVNLAPIGSFICTCALICLQCSYNLGSLHVIFHSLNYDRYFTAKRPSLRQCKLMKLRRYVLFKTIFIGFTLYCRLGKYVNTHAQ